ncbi:methyltransferase-like protein 25B isoform X2 [Tachypleus tridentatus]|uniref:methyltransferase-like protein 25B isoform X2 n=1 Tax=Tachypleus tridentatus TaxID=6853 RepID=UPI003FD1C46B
MVHCSNENFKWVKQYSLLLMKFLNEYSWLTEAFVLDFFTENHWNKLPLCWSSFLSNVGPQELGDWLSEGDISYKQVWPLSLQAYRATVNALALTRKPISSPEAVYLFLNKIIPGHPHQEVPTDMTKVSKIKWLKAVNEFSATGGQHVNLEHIFRRRVIDLVLKQIQCDQVIDVGSGQGHLARLLALGYHFQVATVEAEEQHVSGAQKLDEQALSHMKKKEQRLAYSVEEDISNELIEKYKKFPVCCHEPPKHLRYCVSASSTPDDLLQVLNDSWPSTKDNFFNDVTHFGLVGLHTCGNLASTMLRLFTETSEARMLLSVGCCYMKLDINSTGLASGYPLSSFIRNKPEHKLNYEALEVACHAIEKYSKKLKENASSLKIHCYRATLEALISKYYPDKRRYGLRSVSHADRITFTEYVQKALNRIQLYIPDKDVNSSWVASYLEQWEHVVVFYSLRLLLAPVIESLVLIDRMLYLYEKGIPSLLIPLFDPDMSPRNQVLLAVKVPDPPEKQASASQPKSSSLISQV